MKSERALATRSRCGFVFGELLIALLLLAVAVSSLAALMYSVSRRPEGHTETVCAASAAARGKCVPEKNAEVAAPASSKLLRSGCETRSIFDQRKCQDTVYTADDSVAETVVKPRTDSAAMALLAKKQKAQAARVRADRGFIR